MWDVRLEMERVTLEEWWWPTTCEFTSGRESARALLKEADWGRNGGGKEAQHERPTRYTRLRKRTKISQKKLCLFPGNASWRSSMRESLETMTEVSKERKGQCWISSKPRACAFSLDFSPSVRPGWGLWVGERGRGGSCSWPRFHRLQAARLK